VDDIKDGRKKNQEYDSQEKCSIYFGMSFVNLDNFLRITFRVSLLTLLMK
jgi:hypothetical protein